LRVVGDSRNHHGQAEIGLARYATGGRGTIAHLTAGVHSASIPSLVDKPMDFGVGYGVDLFEAKEGETSKVRTHGLYGEASRYVVRQPFWRVSVGGRGEMLFGGGEIGWGALARGAIELLAVRVRGARHWLPVTPR
jgi:hypothetical protein